MALKKLEHYQEIARRMVEADRERDKAYVAYDKMDHCEWQMPAEMKEMLWIRKVVSTEPRDAISAGTRVLTSMQPKITVQPLAGDLTNKKKANDWEKVLQWQLSSANRRRQGKVERDVVRSALKYDEIVMNVVDLDYQIAAIKLFAGRTDRLKNARRYGRYMVTTFNPQDVHVRYSNAMPEAVLVRQNRMAQEVLDEWGDLAKGLRNAAENNLSVVYYDYMDWDVRVVWCEPEQGEVATIVKPTEHNLPFFPWVATIGGDTMESKPEHKRQPMLYSVHTSGQWYTKNVTDTLMISEVIAHSIAPRLKEEGPNPDESDQNYGDPTRKLKVAPGNVVQPIPPPMIDKALAEVGDRLGANMEASTVSKMLISGQIATGAAFASLNLATQVAIGALKPAKELAEKALAEMFTIMLLWMKESGKALTAYGTDKRVDLGTEYMIAPEEIAEDALYISVELTPDVPTDRAQRANIASMLVQWGYPKEMALEDMGVTNPQQALETWYYEKLLDNELNIYMQGQQAEAQMEQQMAQQEQAMAAQQAQTPTAGLPMMEGQGFNPAQGGLPPAMFMPSATRENQNGVDMQGNPMQGGGMMG